MSFVRSININQNQGGLDYPFDSGGVDCVNPFKGITADIRVISDAFLEKDDAYEVYVKIETVGTDGRKLTFTDSTGKVLVITDDLVCTVADDNRFWFFIDKKGAGRETVYYWEYADKTPVSMETPVKLVSRCWSSAVKNIYYVENLLPCESPTAYSNNLEIHLLDGFTADINGNTITLNANTIGQALDIPADVLRTINQAPGDINSNFSLYGDKNCIDVSANTNGSVIINNDCGACCDCDDYANTYEMLRRLIVMHNYEISYLNYLTEYYDALKDYYKQVTEDRMQDVAQVRLMQSKTQVSVWFSISNPEAKSIKEALITLKVTVTGAPAANRITVKRLFASNSEILKGHCNIAATTAQTLEYQFKISELKAHGTWVGALNFLNSTVNANMEVTATITVPTELRKHREADALAQMKLEALANAKVCSTPVTSSQHRPVLLASKPAPPKWKEDFSYDDCPAGA